MWIALGATVAGVLVLATRASAATGDAVAVTADSSTGYTDGVRLLALAIAHAEVFFVAGSIPQRANNPGDLVVPHWTGGSLGDQRISVFQSADQGWSHLYAQLQAIADGRSHVYTADMTLAEMGEHWTATQAGDWTRNVVAFLDSHSDLDVTADTTIGEVLA